MERFGEPEEEKTSTIKIRQDEKVEITKMEFMRYGCTCCLVIVFTTMCYKTPFNNNSLKSLDIFLILVSVFQGHVVDVNLRFKKWISIFKSLCEINYFDI